MNTETSPLKVHLEKLTNVFKRAETLRPDETLILDAVSARTVLKTLKVLTQQAGHLELEVSILRDSEAGKLVADTAEQLATGELAGMLDAADSNVIRYDFGGKKDDQ
ncbi:MULTISPECIES: hypothetical protein [unclassified Rhizobium]|uniref:hypothetical protein n=1 Tax=unclassified Rhizobium TaxID=2613769 RepID=UPI0017806340|nr:MULTISPECIES: hypothetical protein [unclassified Rhizobium]MBD8686599.1 hypothetical protein [Rhizobium sp. CFBP 13644]MBD8691599.1 hypothetical protein [Rhizobium sp. CFBP 13717]